MVMNTISPIGANFIPHAEAKGGGWFPDSGRGSMVRYLVGQVSEYSSDRLVYDKNDISPKHIPDQCVSAPISMRTTVALIKGMQDRVWKDSEVC